MRVACAVCAIVAANALCLQTVSGAHAQYGRIDIYVVGKAFDLGELATSPKATTTHCS